MSSRRLFLVVVLVLQASKNQPRRVGQRIHITASDTITFLKIGVEGSSSAYGLEGGQYKKFALSARCASDIIATYMVIVGRYYIYKELAPAIS